MYIEGPSRVITGSCRTATRATSRAAWPSELCVTRVNKNWRALAANRTDEGSVEGIIEPCAFRVVELLEPSPSTVSFVHTIVALFGLSQLCLVARRRLRVPHLGQRRALAPQFSGQVADVRDTRPALQSPS